MREIILQIERNEDNGNYFDLQTTDQDGYEQLLKITPEQLHNLVRSLVNKAMESLD